MAQITSHRVTIHPRIEPSQYRTRSFSLESYLRVTVAGAAFLGFACAAGYPVVARAQTPAAAPVTVETVVVRAQRRLLKEKNSPSASTEIGAGQIAQVGIQGSVASLLRNAPSVNVYQQGIGNSEPVISIRGVRGLETAETLDGVPMQDLLDGGTGAYLQNIIGGRYGLDQISGVTVYPGVAYPDENTFGTIGGTVAFDSLRPSNDGKIVVTGSWGSFKTYNEGIELDSGQFDSGLGTGDDGIKLMAKYSNEQTAGFVDNTPGRYNSFEAAFDKPYDDGLSKIQGTLLFNTGYGLYTDEPLPLPYLDQNGLYSNYPTSEDQASERNQYLTIYLKDDKYLSDLIPDIGATAFYLNSHSDSLSYGNINLYPAAGNPNPYSVGGALPFIQTVDGFLGSSLGLYGPGALWWDAAYYPYDGNAEYPAGTSACPAYIAAEYPTEASPCGYNSSLIVQQNHTYGFQPRITITPPDIFGIGNTIKLGGMIAKEVGPQSFDYFGATPNVPETATNNSGIFGATNAHTQRTIFQVYAQDKIDFLDDTLHITPGATLEGTQSSYEGTAVVNANPTVASCGGAAYYPCDYGPFKAEKWDRDALPFLNIAYDLDKILPIAKGASIYASMAQSALFAPVTDFSPNILLQGPPDASIVHLAEGGVQYDTSKLGFKADYFYQKIDRDFGFFQYQSGPAAGENFYDNFGQREIKGVEGAFTWQATPDFQVFGNASHQLDKYLVTSIDYVTVQEDQYGFVQKDSPATGVPDWLATFGVDYDHKSLLQPSDELNVRFDGQYTGHQYTSYDTNGYQCYPAVAKLQHLTCGTYAYYDFMAGQTLLDPDGGISPHTIFNIDASYTMATPSLKFLRQVTFDVNGLNIFGLRYFQYFYKQISPGTSECAVNSSGILTSGPYKGQAASNYCGPSFADGIPGEPAAVTFTVTAKF